jgi:prepilin-type N-terminal cleavage/methylation domain-containing protein
MRTRNRAFTLVEIMIVILIIGVLLAIAVPNFFKARANSYTKTCVSNLTEIDRAKEQFAMSHNLTAGADIAQTELSPDYIRVWPQCPANGIYSINGVDDRPTCSLGGTHTLAKPILSGVEVRSAN